MVTQANINQDSVVNPPQINTNPFSPKSSTASQDSFVWRAFLLSKGVNVKRT